MKAELDGAPVREVPPDWIGENRAMPQNPDPLSRPIVVAWAKHPNGTYTPVYAGSWVAERWGL